MNRTLLTLSVALSCMAAACTFKAPDANKPLGCACDARPNAYAGCKYDACTYAGCRPAFVDLDKDPSNGCETDTAHLPGNLVIPMGHRYHGVTWYSEYDATYFDVLDGFFAATVSDLTCIPSSTQPCDVRVEAFQLSGSRAQADGDEPSEVVVATNAPYAGTQRQTGITFTDVSALAASFGEPGGRSPMMTEKGFLNILVYPFSDGAVHVSIEGELEGYIDDRKGSLSFGGSSKTPQLFDASVPDAGARDVQVDGDAQVDAAESDATFDDAVGGQ